MALVLHFCGGGHGHSHGGATVRPQPSGSNASSIDGHSHEAGIEHGHSHSKTTKPKKRVNINVRAAFIHVLGDFCQSCGVFVAALVIYFVGDAAKIADPICTFVFSLLVLFTTVTILRDVVNVLMEGGLALQFAQSQAPRAASSSRR